MRVMIRVALPVEAGNAGIRDGSLPKTIQSFMAGNKPEAAYFFTENGKRTCLLVVDLKDVSQIPALAEPFFLNHNAAVDFTPVMNAEELAKGLEGMGKPKKK